MVEENIIENPDFDGDGFFKEEGFSEIENPEKVDQSIPADQIIEIMTADEFFSLFRSAFAGGSAITGLKSLEIGDDERGARLLSDKLYRIISGNSILRKLLENGGLMALDWFIILSWAGKKTVSVVAEKTGTDKSGAVQVIAQAAGKGFIDGIISKFKFWGKK